MLLRSLGWVALLFVPGAFGQEAAAQPAPSDASHPASEAISLAPAQAPGDASLGLSFDLGISTAYVLRGYNVFQKSSQWDQHPFAAPSITYVIPKTGGLSIGYWGAYQLAGANITEAMDAGLGAENDFILSYGHSVSGAVSGGLGFTAYIYPAAKEETAGTRVPIYVEPAMFATFATVADLGIKIAYYHGTQQAISAYRYVYFNPTVGKTVAFNDRVSLAATASFGLKLFTDRTTSISKFNTVDLLIGVGVPVTIAGPFYVKPSVSWAWTNFPDRSMNEEMVVFGGANLGVSL